jgi:hypothetical protein
MSTFKQDHEAREREALQAQSDALSARAYFEFLQAHRELVPVESNHNILKDYFNGDPFTVEALEEALQNPAVKKQLAFQTSDQDRKKSLETIQRITGRPADPFTTPYQSDEELAAKASELERRRELRQMSKDELRAIIQAGRPAPVEVELPSEYTRKSLLALSGKDLRRLMDRFGSAVINRRLANQG